MLSFGGSIINQSFIRKWKIKSGGIELPLLFIQSMRVTVLPVSPDVSVPTCLLPLTDIIFVFS